jgi:hypothetical protein
MVYGVTDDAARDTVASNWCASLLCERMADGDKSGGTVRTGAVRGGYRAPERFG